MTRTHHLSLTAALLLVLAACGGSDAPTRVAISASGTDTQESVALGDAFSVRLQGRWTVLSGPTPASVFVQVRDAGGSFAPSTAQASAGSFAVDVPLRDGLGAGLREGALELRACRDAACAQPIEGDPASVSYRLTLHGVDDWSTHQGNNAHTAFVPIRLDPARFRQVWTWQRPASPEPIGGINAVATRAGRVFVSTDVYFGDAVLHALGEADGLTVWTRSLGRRPGFGPPAVSADRVYAATTGHQDTLLWIVDARDGSVVGSAAFDAQWVNVLSPTIAGGQVFAGAGAYAGQVYAFSALDGARQWSADIGGVTDLYALAADDRQVYHHNGQSLNVLARGDGTLVASIDDPLASGSTDHAYHGGPMIGSGGVVVSFAGGAFSGRAASSVEHVDPRVLSAFSATGRRHLWASGRSYLTTPALANGRIYAAGNSPATLDALDEESGRVVWSFTPDAAADGREFHRNIVATRTHLFVSTDRRVLAIDLRSGSVVWRFDRPGMLAISADRTLYIATGSRESDGGLVAVRLR